MTSKGNLILKSKESLVLGTQTKCERNLALVPGNQKNENTMVLAQVHDAKTRNRATKLKDGKVMLPNDVAIRGQVKDCAKESLLTQYRKPHRKPPPLSSSQELEKGRPFKKLEEGSGQIGYGEKLRTTNEAFAKAHSAMTLACEVVTKAVSLKTLDEIKKMKDRKENND